MKKLRSAICWCPGRTDADQIDGSLVDLMALRPKFILDSWASIDDRKTLGHAIFKRIFCFKPALKSSFGLKGVSNEQLEGNPRFKTHAGNFINFLNAAVQSLNGKKFFVSILLKIRKMMKKMQLWKIWDIRSKHSIGNYKTIGQ